MDAENVINAIEGMGTWDHDVILTLKIVMSSEDFQGIRGAIFKKSKGGKVIRTR